MFKKYTLELRYHHLVIIAKNKEEVVKLLETMRISQKIIKIDVQPIDDEERKIIEQSIVPPFVKEHCHSL